MSSSIVLDLDQTSTGLVRLIAVLSDGAGNPLSNKPIKFYVSHDGILWASLATVYTDNSGVAAYTTCIHDYYAAVFNGDAQYAPSQAKASYWDFRRLKGFKDVATTLALRIEPVSDTQVKLIATLKDINGCPVIGSVRVQFSNDEKTWEEIAIGTNASGVAIYTFGKYNVYHALFDGGAFYWPSYVKIHYATGPITPIGAIVGTILTLQGGSSGLIATLRDIYGVPLANEYIMFGGSNDGVLWDYLGSFPTDEAGRVTLVVPEYNIYQAMYGGSSRPYKWSLAELSTKPRTKLELMVK